jgi:hypothetical protein
MFQFPNGFLRGHNTSPSFAAILPQQWVKVQGGYGGFFGGQVLICNWTVGFCPAVIFYQQW